MIHLKMLVAGGAGFIGSHLVDALLKLGHQVVNLDSFFIGTRENIAHLHANPNHTFCECDLRDLQKLRKIFEREQVGHVFHLAANSDIQASAANPMIEYQNTYTTTFNLLECMREYQVRRLFFSSTSAVYGEKEGKDVSESDTPLEPISYYGAAKLGSEALISAYSHMNRFSSLIFRFPNVIGPRLTHGVIYDFIRKLTENPSRLEILGNGNQTKPYMYVSDLVEGIVQFMQAGEGVTTYNIGVDSRTKVTAIADIVCRGMGLSRVEYRYTGGRGGWRGDVPVFSYDLSRIHAAGWRAGYTSDQAVEATVREVLSCRR